MSYTSSSPIPVSTSDIDGANRGQRPDLINLAGALFVTTAGKQYRVWRGRIVDEVVPLSEDTTMRADDDGIAFRCTTALTIFVPELLSPRPTFIVNAPPTGNVSLDPTGAAQLNGAGTTLTRSRSSNPAGVAVVAYSEADGYGVSGS